MHALTRLDNFFGAFNVFFGAFFVFFWLALVGADEKIYLERHFKILKLLFVVEIEIIA